MAGGSRSTTKPQRKESGPKLRSVVPCGWLCDLLLPEWQGAVHSRCRAPTVRGHRACASGLCWEEHRGPHTAQGGI